MTRASSPGADAAVSPERRAQVDAAREAWVRKLIDLSRRNNLLYFRDLKVGTLDLSHASADALTRLLRAVRSDDDGVPLDDLVMPDDRERAAAALKEIAARALSNLEEPGLDTLFLGLGLATWPAADGGRPTQAPVLLVPIHATMRGREARRWALRRAGDIKINDVLVHAMEAQYGVSVDAEQLIEECGDDEHEPFDPEPLFETLRLEAAQVPGFAIERRRTLGNFAFQKLAIVRDLKEYGGQLAAHTLIAAIAGDEHAAAQVRQGRSQSTKGWPQDTREAARGTPGASMRDTAHHVEVRLMKTDDKDRLSNPELVALFDRLFPHGLAGADVLADIAPEGWERSPLLACFHPSIERIFEEQLQFHRHFEKLGTLLKRRGKATPSDDEPPPEPTLESVRREHQPRPVRQDEEVTELVGQCLWDVFSDNHDVIAADGRVADIGSFRGASAFLDEYLTRAEPGTRSDGDYMRFYLGSIWVSRRADLMPVYAMIFRRLQANGADWIYYFPEIGIVDLSAHKIEGESTVGYSPTPTVAAELEARKGREDFERLRAELSEGNARAREEAMDRPPPTTVRAYRAVFRRDPRGWPPV